MNAWFGNPPLSVPRPRTENHCTPFGRIPPPLFNAQVQPILSCIFAHSGRIVCALATAGRTSDKTPMIAAGDLDMMQPPSPRRISRGQITL
jgi:hypothetical protein